MKTAYTSRALAVCTIVMLVGGLAFAAPDPDAPPGQGPNAAPDAAVQMGAATPAVTQPPTTDNGPSQGPQSVLDGMMVIVVPVVELITTDAGVASKAKITREQVSKLKPILDKAKRQRNALIDQQGAAGKELKAELDGNPKPDKAKVSALVKKELESGGELADLTVNLIFDVIAVTSREQLKRAFEIAIPMLNAPNKGATSKGAPQGSGSRLVPRNDTMLMIVPVVERITTDAEFAANAKISKEQVAKLKPIVDKAKRQNVALMEKVVAADGELKAELDGDTQPPTRARVSALAKKELALWGELADLVVNFIFDAIPATSAEQLTQALSSSGAKLNGPNTAANQGTPPIEPGTTPIPSNSSPTVGPTEGAGANPK